MAFYRDLAERLSNRSLSPDEAVAQTRMRNKEVPLSPTTIEELRTEAEAGVVHSPRESWALAYVAHAALKNLADKLLETECALTLAVALNALGRFAEAMERLPTATELFLIHDRPDRASRCYSETVLACTYLGRFEDARAALTRARDILDGLDAPVVQAHCDRAEGLLHQEQNRYLEAVTLFHRAGEIFAANGCDAQAALTWCDIAYSQRYVDPQEALFWLDRARRVPALKDSIAHNAKCDFIRALVLEELNRYTESLDLCRQAQADFFEEDLDFLVAFCDLSQGVIHYRLNQYTEAQEALTRAREAFAAQALSGHVTMCDLNTAIVFYAMNRYTEALALYQQVAEEAMAEGRSLRAARCHTNMGLCYDRLGRYDLALTLHDRARHAFLEADDPIYAALCQENVAGTYHALGRHDLALTHYLQARETFAEAELPIYVAYCNLHLANLHLTLNRHEEALACLEQARIICQREGMTVYVALCDREMARAWVQTGRGDKVSDRVKEAKAVFVKKGLLVDAALCDLVAGEVHLSQDEAAQAVRFFAEALTVLDPGFPDEAWRARHGLGHCALAQGDRLLALEHWRSAIELVNQIRVTLPTERLSGGFFSSRHQLYEAALQLALEIGAEEQALIVAEAGKAQAIPSLRVDPFVYAQAESRGSISGDKSQEEDRTEQRGWRRLDRDDPYLAELLHREETLRQEMMSLRRKLSLLEMDKVRPPLCGEGELRNDQPEVLAQLAELAEAYEGAVERLRLLAPNLLEAHSPVTFSARKLRQAAATHLSAHWACLAYYILDDTLIIFCLDSQKLHVYRRSLNAYDRLALRQCTDPARDFRELIYRGMIRGHRAPGALGKTYLHHLHDLLIPPEVEEQTDVSLLIIAPHGPLHGLPFQALLDDDSRPLAARAPLTYVPSLSALHSLLKGSAGTPVLNRVLACGLSEFGERASRLPHAVDEMAALGEVLGNDLHTLWDAEATRDALLRLDESGDLANYNVIHFVTHAVLDHLAPSQSRVLLADGGLTLADILNLRLGTWMVVLSACEGAIGQQHPGDEIMGLARAFFLTGTRTVVASLWPVEDTSAAEFMGRFYRRLGMGASVAQALRAVQVEMANEGWDPYQWAPFIAIGLP